MSFDSIGIWEYSLKEVKNYGKSYKAWRFFVCLVDILGVATSVVLMYKNGVSFSLYLQIMLCFVIIASLALNVMLDEQKYNAYLFYNKYKKKDIECIEVKVNTDDIHTLLYTQYKSRLKNNSTLDSYVSIINNVCSIKQKFSEKVIPLIECLPDDNADSSLYIYYITKKGNKKVLVLASQSKKLD